MDQIQPAMGDGATGWHKDRHARKDGLPGLECMPRERHAWHCTIAASAYSDRLQIAGEAGFDLRVAMHGGR